MTNQTRFCPHCGNELKPDAKFCPKCGYALGATTEPTTPTDPERPAAQAAASQPQPQAQPEPTAAPSGPNKFQKFSGNYFSWYLETLRHPSQPRVDAHRFFGLISLLVEALLLVLTFMLLGQKAINLANRMMSSFDDSTQFASYLNLNGVLFKTGLILFLIIVFILAIYVGIAYAFRRVMTNLPLNFWDFTNQFAGTTNLLMIFNLITFLLGLITGSGNFSSLTILMIFMIPANLILNAAFIFIIVDDVDHSRMDKFYTVLLAELSLVVALFIFSLIIGSVVGGSIMNDIQSLYNS